MDTPLSPSNEQMVVKYLLGELPEQQQVEIEDQAFQDKQFLQNILAVESDLIDEYVRGEISPAERQNFESHFLASAERRRKVEFARALAAVADENETSQFVKHSVRENPLVAFVRSLRPAMTFSLAALALLVVVGGALLVRSGLRLRSQLAQLQAERQVQEGHRQQLEKEIADEKTRNDELARQIQQQQQEEGSRVLPHEEAKPTSPSTQSVVAALTLLPGLTRGGDSVPTLVLSPDVRTVRLQIGMDPQDDFPAYRVEIVSQSGKTIWEQDKLTAHSASGRRIIALNVPAKLLDGERYEVALKGTGAAGTTEEIGYYYFKVMKK